jgi:hypothetical protein
VCTPKATQACPNGTETCDGTCNWGGCVCASGYTSCNSACVDEQNDVSNCGGCGSSFACTGLGEVCKAGVCVCPQGGCPTSIGYGDGKIALDASNVYWTDLGSRSCSGNVCTAHGYVYQAPLHGSAATTTTLASQIDGPFGVTVDASTLYWVTTSDWIGQGNGTVNSVPIGGMGSIQTLASNLGYPYQIALYNGYVYFSTGQANRVSLSTGKVDRYQPGSIWAGGLAVGSSGIYWEYCPNNSGNTSSCTIGHMGLDGTNESDFATGISTFSDLVMDASNVYWVDLIGGAAVVRKQPLGGTTATTVGVASPSFSDAGYNSYPLGIAIDAKYAYVNLGSVIKVDLATGVATTVSPGGSSRGAIAVNATDVYWITSDQLAVHAK